MNGVRPPVSSCGGLGSVPLFAPRPGVWRRKSKEAAGSSEALPGCTACQIKGLRATQRSSRASCSPKDLLTAFISANWNKTTAREAAGRRRPSGWNLLAALGQFKTAIDGETGAAATLRNRCLLAGLLRTALTQWRSSSARQDEKNPPTTPSWFRRIPSATSRSGYMNSLIPVWLGLQN